MMASLRFVVALSAVLALASSAFAGGKVETAKSQEKKARAACLMGDYQKGTKILVDLFIETGNPVHLFNQGRCYEQNHRWEEAIDRFHEYLRKDPNLDPNTRAYVDKHIAECESRLPKVAPMPPPAPPPPRPTVPAAEPSPAPTPPTPAAAPTTAQDPGSTLKIVGIVTAALGIASLGVGTYEYVRHESLVNDLKENGGQYSDAQYSDKQNQISNAKTMSWVGFGVGAAGLLAGTTMYLLGRTNTSSGTEHAAVTFVPSISPGQTSLFIAGAF